MNAIIGEYLWVEVRTHGKWRRIGAVFTNPEYKPEKPIDGTNKPRRSYYTWQRTKTDHHPLTALIERVFLTGWPEYADIPGRDPHWRHRDEWWEHEYYGSLIDLFTELEYQDPEKISPGLETFVLEMMAIGDPENVYLLHEGREYYP